MNILAIDSGNTRIKWGLWQSEGAGLWTHVGAALHDQPEELLRALAALPAPQRIAVANVAGQGAAQFVARACAGFGVEPMWVRPQAAQCGVTCRYDIGQLGADRWAALIGARHRQRAACLVVGAGTATTADMLTGSGEYLGGIIFPGLDLMKRSLADNTARLPFAEGSFERQPRNTADAIETGVLQAQAGAIERMHAELSRHEGAQPLCLVSGGSAEAIGARLNIAHKLADHLVLEGLVCMASS